MKEIILSAHRKSWRMLDLHADEFDKRYASIRNKILERDQNTCYFCGFKSSSFQEVHHLDDDHGNNSSQNLVTACPFCHMNFHLGISGVKDLGIIIWCPELSQIHINVLSKAIFVAIANKGKFEEGAKKIYEQLESRASIIRDELGDNAINPGVIGQAFLEMSDDEYNNRNKKFHGLRLLPKMSAFTKQIAFWQSDSSVFGGLNEKRWGNVLLN